MILVTFISVNHFRQFRLPAFTEEQERKSRAAV
jgi:hypothetical protein